MVGWRQGHLTLYIPLLDGLTSRNPGRTEEEWRDEARARGVAWGCKVGHAMLVPVMVPVGDS